MLANPAAFFGVLRAGKFLGPKLSPDEVEGVSTIIEACDGWSISRVAYALGTTYHETRATMQPIHEDGGPGYFFRMYDKDGARPKVAAALGNTEPGDGVLFAGRGYVQLTGRRNYSKARIALGVALVSHPDLAMQPAVAARILRWGMETGAFTGKSIRMLPEKGLAVLSDFVKARAIINGSDRAADIARYAQHFQSALSAGEWK